MKINVYVKYMDNEILKYKVVHKTQIDTHEELPKFFLADNPIEAEEIYIKFKKLLNSISYSYAISTGIPKSDLFGEALLGLAKACCDWDSKRSDKFRTYTIFRIKDALNEYVRKNGQIITIPSYIKKSNALLNRIKTLLEKFEVDTNDIYTAIFTADIENIAIPDDQKETCNKMLKTLVAAAVRANVDYTKFVRRIEYLPVNINIDQKTEQEFQKTKEKQFKMAIMVEKLKSVMNKNELSIADGIMKGLNYKEIGKEFGKSDAWVCKQLKNLRKKILDKWDKDK
jgi:RNA polymerase sigma factor (sigma-70 family)